MAVLSHEKPSADATSPKETALRPPFLVMTPEHLGSVWAGPLSFARSLLKIVAREGWQVSRPLFALNGDGEGEALYRIGTLGQDIFFYVLSFSVPEDEKTDRVIGVRWDAMGSLFIGDPSPERLATMRREMPHQKTGRADADTLIWLRGNKSSRSFERAVAALADGRQPDAEVLQSTGYLFRTTAFYGNGKLGTMPYAAVKHLDVLSEPYHAQLMAAWMLREFISDLVDHLAAARSLRAVKLDQDHRRYLGIGNSAGVGIVPFITRHPKIVDEWVRVYETVIAEMRHASLDIGDEKWTRLRALVERAERYFSTLSEAETTFFMMPSELSEEMGRLGRELERRSPPASRGGRIRVAELMDWAAAKLQPEVAELVNVMLMEFHGALIDAVQPRLSVDEVETFDPEMTVQKLRMQLDEDHGWASRALTRDGARHYFWYRSHEAGEPRYSEYGNGDWRRLEVSMDAPIQLIELRQALDGRAPGMTVAEFLLLHPDLHGAVHKVQSRTSYGEVRANLVGKDLVAMPLIRFLLAFYGMERFAPGSDRWVRGTLLQGAPTADDVTAGLPGTWPFPLLSPAHPGIDAGPSERPGTPARPVRVDDTGDGQRVDEVIRGHRYTLLPISEDATTRVSTVELAILAESMLRRLGVPASLAQAAGDLLVLAEILTGRAMLALGDLVVRSAILPDSSMGADLPAITAALEGASWIIDAPRTSLVQIAPLVGEVLISLGRSRPVGAELAVRGARHAQAIVPALLADLLARGFVFSAELAPADPTAEGSLPVKIWDAATLLARSSDLDPEMSCQDSGVLIFRLVEPWRGAQSAPRQPEIADHIRRAVQDVERSGLIIDSVCLRPIVELADTILLEPNAESRSNWGKGH